MSGYGGSMKIQVDSREKEYIYGYLVKTFPAIEFDRLVIKNHNGDIPAGDYSSEHVIAERKTLADLHSSLIGPGGRLDSQVDRLSMIDDKIVIFLITGNMAEFIETMAKVEMATLKALQDESGLSNEEIERRSYGKASADANRLIELIASLTCRYGFLVWRFDKDEEGLIEMIKFMVKVEEGKWLVPSRRNYDTLCARLLRVTPYQWYELKTQFGSLFNIAQADENLIQVIYRIGPKRAAEIKRILLEGE